MSNLIRFPIKIDWRARVAQLVTDISEVGGSNLMWENWYLLTNDQQFTVQNLDQMYVLVFSAHKTTRRDLTCTVLKAT